MKKVSFNIFTDSGFETDVILHIDDNTDSYIRNMITRMYLGDGFFVRNIVIEDLEYDQSMPH